MSDLRTTIATWRPLGTSQAAMPASQGKAKTGNDTFAAALTAATVEQSKPWNISSHAQQRLQQRGITLSDADLQAMDQAANLAQKKGAKNTYMILGQAGFVVNLPSRTVVTAMENKDHPIVTQIDSVVFVN
ncbi:hypothetical protein [Alicyclobacillus suci]|uniref:hypothetical protein n=1 Tax=Alicyclobacillus suci TaxID=2816080 RepID=UPI001A8C2CF2|nr:hypothetical protein [Alicyclobacillus suci]